MNLRPVFNLDAFEPEVINGWEPGQRSVVIPVAACLETDCSVTYRCHLVPAPSICDGCWEFSFDFSVDWLDDSQESFVTMDGRATQNHVPDELRPFMIPAVCVCIDALVGDCSPEHVYRVTKGRNLPEKAMQKHHIIRDRFIDLGYTIAETGLDPAGRRYWLMGHKS